jgi:hypothetical protein
MGWGYKTGEYKLEATRSAVYIHGHYRIRPVIQVSQSVLIQRPYSMSQSVVDQVSRSIGCNSGVTVSCNIQLPRVTKLAIGNRTLKQVSQSLDVIQVCYT